MSLIRYTFLVAMALSLVACGDNLTPEEEDKREKAVIAHGAEYRLGWTAYVYDKRTGLCLLRSPTTHNYQVYVPVECTPAVKKLLLNPPE